MLLSSKKRLAESGSGRTRYKTVIEIAMVISTILAALATGAGAWFSAQQYEAAAQQGRIALEQLSIARTQLSAADRNKALQDLFIAADAHCAAVLPNTSRPISLYERGFFLTQDKLRTAIEISAIWLSETEMPPIRGLMRQINDWLSNSPVGPIAQEKARAECRDQIIRAVQPFAKKPFSYLVAS